MPAQVLPLTRASVMSEQSGIKRESNDKLSSTVTCRKRNPCCIAVLLVVTVTDWENADCYLLTRVNMPKCHSGMMKKL